MLDNKTISITLVKSLIGRKPKHLNSAKALGLRKINQNKNINKKVTVQK